MKLLVTGGAGFIGHNVVDRLENSGHECLIIDNLTNYGVVSEKDMQDLHQERKQYYKALVWTIDLKNDDDAVDEIVKDFQPEVIVHLAGCPRQSIVEVNPRAASDVMVGGTVTILEAAKKYNVRRFVYISSSMVYGNFVRDTDEFSLTNPINQYGIFKLIGESLVRSYAKRTGLQYNIIRPSAVYGERDVKDRIVNKFFIAALNGIPIEVRGADEKLDFTYVEDVAQGIVLSALNYKNFNRIYNITKSRSHTLLEAAQTVVKIVGSGEIRVVDRDVSMPSRGTLKINRAMRELGYFPKIGMEEGFQKCYEWIKNIIYRPITAV